MASTHLDAISGALKVLLSEVKTLGQKFSELEARFASAMLDLGDQLAARHEQLLESVGEATKEGMNE